MSYYTYSFTDVMCTIGHPAMGLYNASGEGLGSISISMTNDNTAHDLAADGSVMISKIKADNGTIAIQVQQTSPLNAWLMKWANYIKTAPTSEFAKGVITILANGETITATGVTPQKNADKPYQQQGQQVTWNLMAANIFQDAV